MRSLYTMTDWQATNLKVNILCHLKSSRLSSQTERKISAQVKVQRINRFLMKQITISAGVFILSLV